MNQKYMRHFLSVRLRPTTMLNWQHPLRLATQRSSIITVSSKEDASRTTVPPCQKAGAHTEYDTRQGRGYQYELLQ